MQLNKVLKGLMIALPVMAIAACSSNKNASNDGSEGMLGAGTGMDANGGNGNMSSEEQARLQMQQLQQNNIVYFDLDKYDIKPEGGDPALCQAALAAAKLAKIPKPPSQAVYEVFKNAPLDFKP